jgi:hypothetical protein
MGASRSKMILWVAVSMLVVISVFAGYAWVTLNWSFSTGERAGFVQKFSKKGWVCKTWEGELLMSPIPGTVPEKFLFSVRDDKVAEKLNNSMGKKINLHYEQHKGVPGTCFAETEYFVTEIRILE